LQKCIGVVASPELGSSVSNPNREQLPILSISSSLLFISKKRGTKPIQTEMKMKIESLRELFIDELKDLYSAENQIIKALPKMIKNATSDELRSAFEEHLEQTKGQVERLDRIFDDLDESPRGKKCTGMEGLLAEGKEIMEEDMEDEVLDAALISAAQRVEHYEIAGYGTVRTYAELLGLDDAVKLLAETLQEEKETDQKLTSIAESVNVEAAEMDEEAEEDVA
jgi:ferritin-like metal-binding protein YciE